MTEKRVHHPFEQMWKSYSQTGWNIPLEEIIQHFEEDIMIELDKVKASIKKHVCAEIPDAYTIFNDGVDWVLKTRHERIKITSCPFCRGYL